MDNATTFSNEFVNQLAIRERGLRYMHEFYLFEDKRLGTLKERFEQDARQWGEWQKLEARP